MDQPFPVWNAWIPDQPFGLSGMTHSKPYAIAFLKFSEALSQFTVFHQALR